LPSWSLRITLAQNLEAAMPWDRTRGAGVNSLADARPAQERRCLDENRQAIEAYNERVAEHGLLSDLNADAGQDRGEPEC
jgi:Post-segregation antitoxin CcdA